MTSNEQSPTLMTFVKITLDAIFQSLLKFCPFNLLPLLCMRENKSSKTISLKKPKGGGGKQFCQTETNEKKNSSKNIGNQSKPDEWPQHCNIVNVTLHASTLSMLPLIHPLFIHPHCQRYSSCIQCIHIANVLFIHPHCQCALHISTLPMLLFIHPHFHCYSRSIFMHLTIQRLQEYRIKFILVVDNVVDFLSRKFMYSGNVVVDYDCSCCSQSNSITYQLQTVDDKTCYVLNV